MPHAYPMMLDVADRQIVIVGGGAVAVRKAKTLIECGATRLRCVAPDIAAEMPSVVERVMRKYESRELDGAGLVFAATDEPGVNGQIVNDARARNILVNRADSDVDDPGDFSTPAQFRESSVTVTVSASGNPVLAAHIRDEIRNRWDARWSHLSDAMKTIRPMIVARTDLPQQRRSEIFRMLATEEALTTFSGGGPAALLAWLSKTFPELKNA